MSQGLARSGFDLDLRHGQFREGELARIFRLRGQNLIEVKSDGRCRETNNFFAEWAQKGKPSGLSVTQADVWAIEFDDDCWLLVPFERLHQLATEAWKRGLRKNGGDHDLYSGVVIPVRWFVPPYAVPRLAA